MKFEITLYQIVISLTIILPFLLGGLVKLISGILLRVSSLNTLEKIAETDISFRKSISKLPYSKYLLLIIGLPVLEEIFFRLIPIIVLNFFTATVIQIGVVGVIVSILFGILHYWNSKSLLFSICIQGSIGIVLFGIFYLQSSVFGIGIAFLLTTGIHLFYNIILNFALEKPKSFDDKDWIINHYYNAVSNRDFHEESEIAYKRQSSIWDKEDEQRDRIIKEDNLEKAIDYYPESSTAG